MTWKPKDVLEFWHGGYCDRTGEYGRDVFMNYEYEIVFKLNNFKKIQELQELEEFCRDNFGKLDENDIKSPWQVCKDIIHENGVMIPKLIFLFHNADDAMAFKLAWSE